MLRLNPIYPNKLHFFINSIDDQEGWFAYGKPCISSNGENIIIIGSHALFFDTETGKTYRKIPSKECILLCVNNKRASSLDVNDKNAKNGYNGIFIKQSINICDKFICLSYTLVVDKEFMEENSKCPYIEYSKSRALFLQSQIPDFPSNEKLKKFKPGTDSLYLKMLLSNYFSPI